MDYDSCVENLVIDSYPVLNIKDLSIQTEFSIDKEREISISINNSTILNKEDILSINSNCIKLSKELELNDKDVIVVVYNKAMIV